LQILIKYWFEFNMSNDIQSSIRLGCGVTAFDYSDAMGLLTKKFFVDGQIPVIKNCIENVDIRQLDQEHIIPNMFSPSIRGIWYPLGYQEK
jgi:hypothetical protein